MDLSMKWLSDFVKIDVSPRQYAAAMTMSGSKVEGYKNEADGIVNVVVGKVLAIEKHKNADSLFVCQVDVGKGAPVQIVTGATNVVAGAMVPVALDGAELPCGKSIKSGVLRGEPSEGMLCSLSELGLTVHDFPYTVEDGIFLIEEACQIGQEITGALGLDDTVVEFEITSNRPDCLSVVGLARETAATFNLPLNLSTPVVKGGKDGDNIQKHLAVAVENPDLCPRYIARMVKNIRIAPSPRWLRERLRASGVRPINNIVDITNYVMLETGQPMHAFDYKYVHDGKIIVRTAKPGEKIMTLDGILRSLSPEMLAITDPAGPIAVAGVMGGEHSGIEDDTAQIVFESACFSGPSVRMTAKKLGLRTESSARFEKGLDAQNCLSAVNRACELVEMLEAGEVIDGIIDVDNSDKGKRTLELEPEWTKTFLGIDVSKEKMVEILKRLDFEVEGDKVTVPSYRSDVEHKADIAEEIARIYGYDQIPITTLRGLADGKLSEKQLFHRRINDTLLALGYNEIITYSFISPKYYDKIRLPEWQRQSVTIANPLGEDTSIMRTTAIPSMMEALARNYNNRNKEAALFEIATEYRPTADPLPEETAHVVIGAYGDEMDFYRLKGTVEQLLNRCRTPRCDFVPEENNPIFHPGRYAVIKTGDMILGMIGEIHPEVCENYDVQRKVYVAKLDCALLFAAAAPEHAYTPLPKYPAVTRDLAITCDDNLPVAKLAAVIEEKSGVLLETLELFDIYKGAQIQEGKKSVAYTLTLRAADRTLTDGEVDGITASIVGSLGNIGASLRE